MQLNLFAITLLSLGLLPAAVFAETGPVIQFQDGSSLRIPPTYRYLFWPTSFVDHSAVVCTDPLTNNQLVCVVLSADRVKDTPEQAQNLLRLALNAKNLETEMILSHSPGDDHEIRYFRIASEGQYRDFLLAQCSLQHPAGTVFFYLLGPQASFLADPNTLSKVSESFKPGIIRKATARPEASASIILVLSCLLAFNVIAVWYGFKQVAQIEE